MFDRLEDLLIRFEEIMSELNEPFVVNDQIRDGKADVTVLKSADKWFGVTYKADKPVVMAALAEMMQNGTYPDPLWK